MAQISLGFWPPQSALSSIHAKRPKSGFGLGSFHFARIAELSLSSSVSKRKSISIFAHQRYRLESHVFHLWPVPHHRNPDLIANPQQTASRILHTEMAARKLPPKLLASCTLPRPVRKPALQYGHSICTETSSQVTAKGDRREITRIGDFAN